MHLRATLYYVHLHPTNVLPENDWYIDGLVSFVNHQQRLHANLEGNVDTEQYSCKRVAATAVYEGYRTVGQEQCPRN